MPSLIAENIVKWSLIQCPLLFSDMICHCYLWLAVFLVSLYLLASYACHLFCTQLLPQDFVHLSVLKSVVMIKGVVICICTSNGRY